MSDYLVTDTEMTSIANAIRTKGGTAASLEFPTDFVTAINAIPSGGGGNPEAEENDVIFIDYDGTIRYSYSAADFANLSALPANPTHDGLTAQGWNWTLADAKTYVATYGKHVIGQTYETPNDAMQIGIVLESVDYLNIRLVARPNGTYTVDWGDGSATETLTGSSLSTDKYLDHAYSSVGEYWITLTPSSSSDRITTYCYDSTSLLIRNPASTSSYNNYYFRAAIRHIRLSKTYSWKQYCLYELRQLEDITIPYGIVAFEGFSSGQLSRYFYYSSSLKGIVLPSGIFTQVSNYTGTYIFDASGICYASMPKDFCRGGQYLFNSCTRLRRICFTNSATSFYGDICRSDTYLTCATGNSPVWTSTLSNCYSLTEFWYQGQKNHTGSCATLSSTFSSCYSLPYLTVGSGCTKINSSALRGLYSLKWLRFEATTPPTVNASSDFSYLPTTCIIYVPISALAAYLSGTNYPNPSTYTYIGYGTYNSGVTLPAQDGTAAYNLTWYATKADAIAQTNAISQGNGSEVYCRYVAV